MESSTVLIAFFAHFLAIRSSVLFLPCAEPKHERSTVEEEVVCCLQRCHTIGCIERLPSSTFAEQQSTKRPSTQEIMPTCGGAEFIPCLMAFPIVTANFVSTTECKTPKGKRNQERRKLLARLNAQVLDEVRVPRHPDDFEIPETGQYVEVDQAGVISF